MCTVYLGSNKLSSLHVLHEKEIKAKQWPWSRTDKTPTGKHVAVLNDLSLQDSCWIMSGFSASASK